MKLMTVVLSAVMAMSGCAYTFNSKQPGHNVAAACSLSSVDQLLAAGEATAGVAVALSGMERNGIDGHRLAYGTFLIEAAILQGASYAWGQRHACQSQERAVAAN